jgi:hypothetical protein
MHVSRDRTEKLESPNVIVQSHMIGAALHVRWFELNRRETWVPLAVCSKERMYS